MVLNGAVKAETLFRFHYKSWRILGFLPTEKYHNFYNIYSIFLNITVTIGYPLHLMVGLFMSKSMFDIIKNLAINLTCLVCSIKTLVIWFKYKDIQEIFEILKRQDERIGLNKEELYYYKFKIFKQAKRILMMYIILYMSSWVLCESSVLLNGLMGTWRLMFPAYFPFDPFASTNWYIVAHVYQYYGVTFQILQDIVNDSFVGMHLALLSGQIHTLSMRVARLGEDGNKSQKQHNLELLKCIQDHKDLLLYVL